MSLSKSKYEQVMNEVQNPIRTLKSVSITALVTACVMYLLVNVAYFIVVPLDEIKHSRELIAALFFERCFGSTVGKTLLPLAVALSAAGNVMVVTFTLVGSSEQVKRAWQLTLAGATKSRSSPTRFSPVFKHPRIVQAVQRTNGWTYRALHSLPPSHYSAAFKRGILVHS